MSSRDCFLWQRVLEFVRDLHGAQYEIVYFRTSRLARAFPSPAYLRYVRAHLPAVIVDIGGTGWSLLRLLERLGHPETPVVFITRYDAPELRSQYEAIGRTVTNGNSSSLLRTSAPPTHLEGMNLAAHAMYMDPPQTFNPLGIDWEQVPEVQAMHAAFSAALDTARRYDFRSDLGVTDECIQDQLYACFLRASEHREWSQVAQSISDAEHKEVMQHLELLSQGVSSGDARD
jgi:hypothetical protein